MTLFAVEGSAGCGKTIRLVTALGEALVHAPLSEGQRVLALTFMHGARRRLHDKLHESVDLRRRLKCVTIDSFAQRLVGRWRSLAAALGAEPLQPEQYDEQCDVAGLLLEQCEVAGWVAESFPIVVIDEAQDLKPQRLRMVIALAKVTRLLIAADEFQCLDPILRPNPCVAWLHETCTPETQVQVYRTSEAGLLAAAAAIRMGQAPSNGKGFRILAAQGKAMAAVFLTNAIAWRSGGRVAIITPAIKGGFAETVVSKVGEKSLGRHGHGPYMVSWERSEDDEAGMLLAGFQLGTAASLTETIDALRRLPQLGIARAAIGWVRRQAYAAGVTSFSTQEVTAFVHRHIALRRQHAVSPEAKLVAMTVQQAKNREFEGVVVIWPYQVGGDAEHKRRLLYNAVTRARRWCTVIVQNQSLLSAPPFLAPE